MIGHYSRQRVIVVSICLVVVVVLGFYTWHHKYVILSNHPVEQLQCTTSQQPENFPATRQTMCPPPKTVEVTVERIVYVERTITTKFPSTTIMQPPQQTAMEPGAIQEISSNRMHNPLMLYEGFDKTMESAQIIPHNKGAANIVFFVWCGDNRLFEFKHMLAALSAIKIQQPLKLIIYYWPGKEPKTDLYNSWLDELKNTFYNFETEELRNNIREPNNCKDPSQLAQVLLELMHYQGGIYMNENTVLRKPLNPFRWSNFVHFMNDGSLGVVTGKEVNIESLIRPASSQACVASQNLVDESAEVCVTMDFDKLYPRDIMTTDSPFGKLARLLFYGSSKPKVPVQDLSDPIPNIGHFYLLGDNLVNFFIYLSIISMVNVLKVDTVYVHGDVAPHGEYWDRLTATGKVQFIYCPPVQKVFGNVIDKGDKFHGKDILSVYFLYLYGGVFIDWDAIFTRPLDDAVRGYDAVMGYDWFIPVDAPTFPEVINPGVLAAKRHSVFISMWLEKYKDFGKKGGFYFTGLLVPYKLYEYYPETVKLDSKFQVICWQQTCHPPWMQGYQNVKFNSDFEWETVYSVHFTYPDPVEFYSEKNLRNATTAVGRMGQRVMGWH